MNAQIKKIQVEINGMHYNYQMNLRAIQIASKRMKMSMKKLISHLEQVDPMEDPKPHIHFCYCVLVANNGKFGKAYSLQEFEDYFMDNPSLMMQINQAYSYNMSLN